LALKSSVHSNAGFPGLCLEIHLFVCEVTDLESVDEQLIVNGFRGAELFSQRHAAATEQEPVKLENNSVSNLEGNTAKLW
jgi:hypothetical protein